ncbi:MAG: SPFH domain-containing protein [Acholeplasmataceae bacterium]|jgi:regulator of protease activity HflC (stomatin/prohibitin superfamily)|nr:SPFH domain-containing protein [Acholeplasmataceae bacterium]
MDEYLAVIFILSFSILSVYLLSRFKMIPANKIGMIKRYGVYYKPIAPGIHFLVPFVDQLVVYDIDRELHLNREVIEINGEPKVSFSVNVHYRIVDERDYHDHNVDQFMRDMLVEVVQGYAERYGTLGIAQQKLALQARLKGVMMERIVEWGIELESFELLSVVEVPTYKKYAA